MSRRRNKIRRRKARARRAPAVLLQHTRPAKLRGAMLAALLEDMSGHAVLPPNHSAHLASYSIEAGHDGTITIRSELRVYPLAS